MTYPSLFRRQLNRAIDRAQARLLKARPASVLILVIAILVLMALIGTAFISTASIERYSSTQNTYNTEVDLLVQGVLNMAQGPMLRKIQGNQGNFRQAVSSSTLYTPGQYVPYESAALDTYLSDRVPVVATGSTFPFWWAYITAPVNGSTFEAPYAVDAASGTPLPAPFQYTIRQNAYPSSINVPQADGTTKLYPALTLTDAVTPINGGRPFRVVAADTDGDGIADAGYVRLPIGQLEGATYYGAVRIIDNAAAINTSVAIEANPNLSTLPARAVPGDLFPVNLDLNGLLISGDTLALLNQYRFNSDGSGYHGMGSAAFYATPVDDAKGSHGELVFNTPYEAFWAQLASRLNNPGYNSSKLKYQPVPIDEGLALAYHFCLANPNTGASAVLETKLPNTTGSLSLRIAPLSPDQSTNWFNQIFNYNTTSVATETRPLRPLLVVRNPLSNFMPSFFNDQGFFGSVANGAASYTFGDRVQGTDPITGNPRSFVCVRPHPVGSQQLTIAAGYNYAYWAPMPWTSHPSKINVNTGSFDQLWTAYWSVLVDSPDSSTPPNYPAGPGQVVDGPAPLNQFRNPIRSGKGALTHQGVIQLRAALAALNTIDMRDGDEDVSSRTIILPSTNGPVFANIYGAEKQPYFTELMIDYEPKNAVPKDPWVAIEIYNPHPTPIPLKNWKLCSLDRGAMKLTEVGDFSTSMTTYAHPDGQTGILIQPGERLVLQNNPGTIPASVASDWAKNKVTPITLKPASGGGSLDQAIGNELVLLRPRQGNGTLTSNDTPLAANPNSQNSFTEGAANTSENLPDLVPLDSIDTFGIAYIPPKPPADPVPQRYRYARANAITADNNSAAWHCVYPGPYALANAGQGGVGPFRTWGIVQVDAKDNPDDGYFNRPKSKFGGTQPTIQSGPNASQYATYETRPLQINNRDSAGPNKLYNESTTNYKGVALANGGVTVTSSAVTANWPMSFPYGGFSRDGDILQVPFIGAYKIYDSGGNLLELNSVTIDSVYAQFLDPSTTPSMPAFHYDMDHSYDTPTVAAPFHNEQIGHFCPMDVGSGDFFDDPTDAANFKAGQASWTYHWAKRLFDYVAVFSPQDAYLPNVDPARYTVANSSFSGDPSMHPAAATVSPKYPNTVAAPKAVPTAQGASVSALLSNQQLQGLQDSAAVEGRININTAGWKALSAVPFYTPTYTPSQPVPKYAEGNATLAQSIVTWRESVSVPGQHQAPGPFRSIFDLMNVPQFRALNVYWMPAPGAPPSYLPGESGNYHGDLSPFAPTMPPLGAVPNPSAKSGGEQPPTPGEADPTDHVFGDVKTRFLALQRISNLVTTRSDSFTVYAQVQGWQNIGSVPNLVATKRAAVLLDRSQVVPAHNSTTGAVNLSPMGVTNVPND